MNKFHCCYHCKDRSESCHCDCKLYLKEKLEYINEKAKIVEKQKAESDLDSLAIDGIKRMTTIRRRKYK